MTLRFMKKLLTLAAVLPLALFGQKSSPIKESLSNYQAPTSNKAFYYVFQNTTGTYQDLSNADYTVSGAWDDPELLIETPFGTDFLGVSTDSMAMMMGSNLMAIDISTYQGFFVFPMFADLMDRDYPTSGPGQSPLSYKVEGTAPNRIFKMEWNNAGFYDEMDLFGTANSYANVQLWLYENETIEFHYGASSINAQLLDSLSYYDELWSGMLEYDFTSGSMSNAHLLSGASSSPTMMATQATLTDWPANGTVYRFQGASVGVDEQSVLVVDLYPNPATTELRVRCDANQEFNVQLVDLSGQVVRNGRLNSNTALNLSGLPAGLYLTKITDVKTGEIVTKRLVVK